MVAIRSLGNTGINLSELGFGCSSFWAKSAFAESEAIGLVRLALDSGISFFDTGPSYAGGQAEYRLGKALKGVANAETIISTKAGSWAGNGGRLVRSFEVELVREGVFSSLRNIDIERIDILHLHAPKLIDISDELLSCLENLKNAGLVRAVGINGYSPDLVDCALNNDVIDSMMFDYNILRSNRISDIRRLHAAGKGFIASTPLAQGYYSSKLFKPKTKADLWYFARAFRKHSDMVYKGLGYRFVNKVEGMSGAQVALAFLLQSDMVASAVFGTVSTDRLKENAQASSMKLPSEVFRKILEK